MGCDSSHLSQRRRVGMFQSTHPRGVRPAGHKDCHRSRDGRRKRFNPRTRVGCDAISTAITLTPLCFNPRTRVGCDPPLSRKRLRCLCSFNPRTRVGCDDQGIGLQADGKSVSIHAPAWGATCPPFRWPKRSTGFNPRTRVGCDSMRRIFLPPGR